MGEREEEEEATETEGGREREGKGDIGGGIDRGRYIERRQTEGKRFYIQSTLKLFH